MPLLLSIQRFGDLILLATEGRSIIGRSFWGTGGEEGEQSPHEL